MQGFYVKLSSNNKIVCQLCGSILFEIPPVKYCIKLSKWNLLLCFQKIMFISLPDSA